MSSESESIDFEGIGQGVLEELNRRLGSPALAQDLPGTLLMKVAESYLKYLERKQAFEESKQEAEKLDPLDVIDQPGLGAERRVVILGQYLEELEDFWQRASKRMEELLKEVVEHGEMVQEMQEMGEQSGVLPGEQVQQGPDDGEAEQPPLRAS